MMRKEKWIKGALAVAAALAVGGCAGTAPSYQQAMELAEEGNFSQALPYFEKAVKEDPTVDAYIGYGMALNHLGQYPEAEASAKKALQALPELSDGEKKQLEYVKITADYGMGSYGKAASGCLEALKIDALEEMDPDISYTMALALHLSGKLEEAEETCLQLVKEDASYMDAWLELASIRKDRGDSDGAVEAYKSALDEEKDCTEALFALAEEYKAAGKETVVQEMLEPLVKQDADSVEEKILAGRACFVLEDYDRAKEYYADAYEEGSREAAFYLGVVQHRLSEDVTAAERLEGYLNDPEGDHIASAYLQLADIYLGQDKYSEAQSAVTSGIACGSSGSLQGLRKDQVILFEKRGKYKKAAKAAKKYLKMYPADQEMKKELSFIKTRIW